MTETSALWHVSAQKSCIRTQPLTPLYDRQCRIETAYSLVSSGTETLVATGQIPNELHNSMRVPYMKGSFSFPVKYGYSLVGKVVEGSKSLIGNYVHLLHPHQSVCRVDEADITIVPEGIPPQRAILTSNLETALNAMWDSRLSAGDRVLVVGMGLIGCLVAHLARQFPAVQVSVAESDSARQAFARNQGFANYNPSDRPYDIAIHTSGSGSGLQTSIDAVGTEGKVIELSWYGTRSVDIMLGSSFHHQRKQIISSQVSQLPPHQQARWDYRRRKQTVLDLLRNDGWDQFLTATVDFADTPKLFDKLRQGDRSELSWTVRY